MGGASNLREYGTTLDSALYGDKKSPMVTPDLRPYSFFEILDEFLFIVQYIKTDLTFEKSFRIEISGCLTESKFFHVKINYQIKIL